MSVAEPQPAVPKAKLRWFQYSLRSLLLITLLTSIGMSCWLAAKMQRIADALKQPTQIEFVETPLKDVAEYLKDLHHIEIRIDRDALQAAGIREEDLLVMRNLNGISLQSGLRLVLRELALTYVIRGRALWITTPQQTGASGAGPITIETGGSNEKRIAEALKQPTQIGSVETPLKDVVDYLKDFHRIEIQLDDKALRQAGISNDTPVSFNLNGVSLQSALRLLLRQLDLDYVIRDEVLFITTPREAAAMNVVQPTYRIPEMVAQEKGLAEALRQPTPLEFVETPLKDVVDYLKDFHHIEIQLDEKALKQAGIDDSASITINRKGVSLRSALSAMLDPLGLEFEIRDEVLLITPKKKDKP